MDNSSANSGRSCRKGIILFAVSNIERSGLRGLKLHEVSEKMRLGV